MEKIGAICAEKRERGEDLAERRVSREEAFMLLPFDPPEAGTVF